MAGARLLGLLALPIPILLLLMWALGWVYLGRADSYLHKRMNAIFYLVGLVVLAPIVVYALHWAS